MTDWFWKLPRVLRVDFHYREILREYARKTYVCKENRGNVSEVAREPRSTFTFTRDTLYITSILFLSVKFVFVTT